MNLFSIFDDIKTSKAFSGLRFLLLSELGSIITLLLALYVVIILVELDSTKIGGGGIFTGHSPSS